MQSKKFTVEDKYTAKNMGSGGLDVLATPALVAFLENVAFEDGAAHCEEGKTTVGSEMNMNHLAPFNPPIPSPIERNTFERKS